MLGLEVELAYIEFMLRQIAAALSQVFFRLGNIFIFWKFLLKTAELLQGLQGEGLVPVDGGALTEVAQPLAINAIGNGLIGGMQFFEVSVGLESFVVSLFIEIGVGYFDLGQQGLLAVREPVPYFS